MQLNRITLVVPSYMRDALDAACLARGMPRNQFIKVALENALVADLRGDMPFDALAQYRGDRPRASVYPPPRRVKALGAKAQTSKDFDESISRATAAAERLQADHARMVAAAATWPTGEGADE